MQVPKSMAWVDARSAHFQAVHARAPETLLRETFARVTRRSVVAEAGCGAGEVTLALASRVRGLTAVDPDEEAVRTAAREAAGRRVRNVTFYQSDLEKEPWRAWLPASPGVCVMPRPVTRGVLERAGEDLPRGTLVVACAFGEEQWQETGRPHPEAFTPEAFLAALRDAGFDVTNVRGEMQVANTPNVDVLENQYFGRAPRVLEAWRKNGRWDALRKRVQGGDGNLTESRLVACATRV